MSEKHKREETPKKAKSHKKGKFSEILSEEEIESSEQNAANGACQTSVSGHRDPPGPESELLPPAWFAAFEKRLDQRFMTLHECVSAEVKEVKESCNEAIEELRKKLETCMDKIDELENRSRRSNLVFFNVPEGVESGHSSCEAFLSSLLTEVNPNLRFNIQRAHRTPTGPRPARGIEKPRPIHAAFGMYQERQAVKKACIEAFKSKRFYDKKLFVSDDLSRRVQLQRKALVPALKKLQGEGKKAFFVYPAVLKYNDGGHIKIYKGRCDSQSQMETESSPTQDKPQP